MKIKYITADAVKIELADLVAAVDTTMCAYEAWEIRLRASRN